VVKGEPLDVETRRRQALERCELLFREALEAAKEQVPLRKADGTEVVVPGDRAREPRSFARREMCSASTRN
jgi:hypothetical protein